LIGASKPFIFSVTIERCLLFSAIFIPLLFSFTYSLLTALLAQKVYSFLSLPVSL
jgi:Na+/melibiose symporter-like transporter